jgi:hybrid cluster-associated redox disulfide protein
MKKNPKEDKITKAMTFEELIMRYPQTAQFLLDKGLHCVGCHAAPTETIEHGALVHGLKADKLIKELNSLVLKEKKK